MAEEREQVAVGSVWADKEKRSPHRCVVVEAVEGDFVHYRNYWKSTLRYRSKISRFVKAFRPGGVNRAD